ncbi:hypothetical protein [Chryseobacterium gossypii]|uniref:hypothetical protein n=1 Tax=Chryseobacterium gossypii TaxID=3231602 RepID=UPI0035234435
MKKITITLGILTVCNIMAQSNTQVNPTNEAGKNVPAIFPPTPESFKFGTYGNIPVGMFTGSPNIDIPITSLSSADINLPIFLNYSSNGIKVDDTNGSVGLGWRFIHAGIITRVIRDLPDELNTSGNIETPDIVTLGLNNPTVINYLNLCKDDNFDSELDLYMANFNGKILKFIIKKNGDIIQLEKSAYKIQRVNSGFKVIDNGTEYIFDATEKVRNFMTNTGEHHGGSLVNTTSWYLSKIKSPDNKEINIEYYDVGFTSVIGQSQSMIFTKGNQYKYGNPGGSGSVGCPISCVLQTYSIPPSMGLVADSNQTVSGKQIKKIYDQNGNYILFEYQQRNGDYYLLKNIKKYSLSQLIENFDFNYDITANDRVFLNSLIENKSGRKYFFEYYNKDSFPSKLSLSRDMWGYFNGISNGNLIPQIYKETDPFKVDYNGANQSVSSQFGYYGLLKKVIYPTGGSTTINYENHKIKDWVTIPASTTIAGVETVNNRSIYSSESSTTIIPKKDGLVYIGLGNAVYGEGNCSNSPILETMKQRSEVVVRDQNGTALPILERSPNNQYYPTGSNSHTVLTNSGARLAVNGIKNQPLTIKVTARFACSYASAQITYFNGEELQQLQDKLLGGYRVSSTIDEAEGSLPVIKNYKYLNQNGGYSIVQAREPYFLENRNVASICEGSTCSPAVEYSYNVLTSTNLNQYNSFNPNIFYSRVIEDLGNRGKVIHEFDTETDEVGSIHRDEISGTALSNTAWKSGKELTTTYLDGNANILKKIDREYNEDIGGLVINYSLATRKNYELISGIGGVGQFDNLDFVLYKNISRFPYLKNQKTTEYLNGNPLVTQTEYFYNNPSNYQLSRQKITLPDATVNETTFEYAHEKGNQLMISKNMVGIPLETITTKTIGSTTKTLSKTETVYPTAVPTPQSGNLVLLLSVKSYDLQNNTSYTEITYDKYDAFGNLQQYTTKDGIPVAIIWGYNGTQPIAKIEGTTYSQASALLEIANIITKSNEDIDVPTQNALITALDSFRNANSRYQITTYTYDPLIGVTSITPPSGIRENYIYDSANRLEKIVDVNGKVLKEFKYNYKN